VIALDRASRERFLQRRVIEAQREEVARERAKSDALLRSILPISIVARLRERPEAVAERLDETSLLFADLVGFTSMSERLGAQRTVTLLNALVSRWDVLAAEAGVEKIKTIGDAYFAAAGVPEKQDDHARRIVDLGLAMIRATAEIGRSAGEPLAIRVGVHSGPVVAGVIGKMKFSYDLWGDTVNVASRLESSGVPGEVQVSAATVELLGSAFDVVPRGTVTLKGKGPMTTFLVRPRTAPGGNGSAPERNGSQAATNGAAPESNGAAPGGDRPVPESNGAAPERTGSASRSRAPGASLQSGHD
jgi:class 3 adenylate cyclase